ncbi:hypothetical protein BRD17_00050 [Halobacteriales archaeon SW_7_68_16]|nr:MAG: hypothetical protein BRD17_00050 [Halobacteriales archaeon SW_7_68_16]
MRRANITTIVVATMLATALGVGTAVALDADDADGALAGAQADDPIGEGETVTVDLDPVATYLHVNEDPDAANASPIDLCAAGIAPGDTVRLRRVGSFGGHPQGVGMYGVFSGSSTLLSADETERVPDAIDAGTDVESPPTFEDREQTDIVEDFRIATNNESTVETTLTVPDGATHLFVSARDNLYGDNTDPDDDFGVEITLVDDAEAGDCPASSDGGLPLPGFGPVVAILALATVVIVACRR